MTDAAALENAAARTLIQAGNQGPAFLLGARRLFGRLLAGGSIRSVSSRTNSSPPRRATVSWVRTDSSNRCAIRTSNRSPVCLPS